MEGDCCTCCPSFSGKSHVNAFGEILGSVLLNCNGGTCGSLCWFADDMILLCNICNDPFDVAVFEERSLDCADWPCESVASPPSKGQACISSLDSVVISDIPEMLVPGDPKDDIAPMVCLVLCSRNPLSDISAHSKDCTADNLLSNGPTNEGSLVSRHRW